MFLAGGATYPGMPPQFAYPAAVGDFSAAVFAFIAIPVTAKNLPGKRVLLRVPALLVTHYVVFVLLLRRPRAGP